MYGELSLVVTMNHTICKYKPFETETYRQTEAIYKEVSFNLKVDYKLKLNNFKNNTN